MTALVDPRNGPDHDLPSCTGARTYVIASSPRTGSTLLARMLWETGRVGAPKEYLNPMQIRDWEVRLGGPLSRRTHGLLRGPAVNLACHGRWTDTRLRDHLQRVRQRRSSGGWFGLKVHWHHFERFFVASGRDPDAFLGDPVWIRIARHDRLAQAVSWVRAWQTGAWVGTQRARIQPVYNRHLITGRLADIDAAEAGWDGVLAGRNPWVLDYEGLSADPVGTTRSVLRHLGVSAEVDVPVPLARQADAISAAWVERYRAGD
ncbi:MAG: Stf0 family sulfotransferase [Myxococcota bacterium]